MSTNEHTPGPWVVDYAHIADHIKSKPWCCDIAVAGRVGFANLQASPDLSLGYSNEEIQANARLIAAAPALLESTELLAGFLTALCEHFDLEDDIILDVTPHNGDAPYKASLCETIKLATTAIGQARATGKEAADA